MRKSALCTIVSGVSGLMLMLCFYSLPLSPASAEQQRNTSDKSEYLLGVYPALPLSQLDKLFSPLAHELEQEIHRSIRFQSSSTYEKYSLRLDRGEFDIALVHPFDYIAYAEKAGYVPLVRKNEELSAIFVVPLDSPIRTIEDLNGKIVAMPPEGSAVSTLAITELTRLGLLRNHAIQLKHFGEHDSSLQNVVIKNAAAAATCRAILRIYESSLGARFRIIGETAAVPHSLFVAHRRVPKRERDLVKKVLLRTTLSNVPPDLRKAFVHDGKKPFVAVSGEDVAKMRIHQARCEGKP